MRQQTPAFRFSGALAASWTPFFERHRDIAVCLSTSAAIHIAVLIVFGAAMYVSGEDDRNVPELSVQLVTREGPSSEDVSEASLPKPVPEPVQPVIDDPGTAQQTLV